MRRKILFVDTDTDELEALRTSFTNLRTEWALAYAQTGQEALNLLERVSFDVIVSDVRVPGTADSTLMKAVMENHSDLIRVALFRQTDTESVMKSIHPAHQYITKPYDSDQLKQMLSRACSLHDRLANDTLIAVVSRMDTLPTIPSLYVELMDELGQEEPSLNKVGEIISKDVGLTTRILKIVNSVAFGCRHNITSTAQAVGMLGLEMIRGMVVSVQVFSQFDHEDLRDFSVSSLWSHSMAAGVLARDIAREESMDRRTVGDTFMAGMLHDVGQIILATNFPEHYGTILDLTNRQEIELCEAEREVLGTTHSEVGAHLMGLWGLSDQIVEAIAFHHYPKDCPYRTVSPLTYVHAANALILEEADGKEEGRELDVKYLEELDLSNQVPIWREKVKKLEEAAT
jgi:HD-like signal output (HDOD) protein/CheY-like chemotaxis protein